jgi:hypothetical protein
MNHPPGGASPGLCRRLCILPADLIRAVLLEAIAS